MADQAEVHHFARMASVQLARNHRLVGSEHGCVNRNANPERQNSNDGKSALAEQHTEAITNVLQNGVG
jgi:hypothetical protein